MRVNWGAIVVSDCHLKISTRTAMGCRGAATGGSPLKLIFNHREKRESMKALRSQRFKCTFNLCVLLARLARRDWVDSSAKLHTIIIYVITSV